MKSLWEEEKDMTEQSKETAWGLFVLAMAGVGMFYMVISLMA